MSRIGCWPIKVPQGVEVAFSGRDVSVKGSKGSLNWSMPHAISGQLDEENRIVFSPKKDDSKNNALWGLTRAMVNNMVIGVSDGFSIQLTLSGVGYRAAMQGNTLNLTVGKSHPVNMQVPEDLTVTVNENTEVVVSGVDKQKVGQFAAWIREVRPPEPYKGKGIRYSNERIVMKEGKKKK